MKRFGLFNLCQPLLSPADVGGSDGGMSGGGDTSTSDASASGASSGEPAVVDIPDENTLIRVKGIDKPVKYGEHVRGFQSQFTRASQNAARLQQQLDQLQREKQEWSRQQQQHGRPQQEDPFAKLAEAPYLSGQQYAESMRGLTDQIKQRDMVTLALANELEKVRKTAYALQQNHSQTSFKSKISNWAREAGAPEDWATELYLAYEGDDLDQEFPSILRSRWDAMKRVILEDQQKAVARAKQSRWLPGQQGGDTGPNKPIQFKGNESPKDVVDQLWDTLQESGT